MNLCHKNFRNILPNKINYNFDSKTVLFPFEKNQIIELISQIDTCIQLLIQVLFFCSFFWQFHRICFYVPIRKSKSRLTICWSNVSPKKSSIMENSQNPCPNSKSPYRHSFLFYSNLKKKKNFFFRNLLLPGKTRIFWKVKMQIPKMTIIRASQITRCLCISPRPLKFPFFILRSWRSGINLWKLWTGWFFSKKLK